MNINLEHRYKALVDHVRQQDEDIHRLSMEVAAYKFDPDQMWHWDPTGDNHLESLSAPVVIQPNDLRELISGKPAPFVTAKGKLLIDQQTYECDILTVENYEKWYCLYILRSDGTVEPVPVEAVMKQIDRGFLWIDHNFSPELVRAVAEDLGLEITPVAYEVIVGRWVTEQVGKYTQ